MSMKQGQVPFQVPWNKEVALERIGGCLDREGPLLPILHALQEEFGYMTKPPSRWSPRRSISSAPRSTASSPSITISAASRPAGMC